MPHIRESENKREAKPKSITEEGTVYSLPFPKLNETQHPDIGVLFTYIRNPHF